MTSGAAIIRAPNHLGDLVMALPALGVAGASDVLAPRGLTPLLALAKLGGRAIAFDRSGVTGFARAVRDVRAGRYDRGVILPPSLSSALLFALGGVHWRRGADTDARAALLTDVVPRGMLAGLHRAAQYHLLVTGAAPATPLVPRLWPREGDLGRWRALAGETSGPLVGIFPGSNAPSRRWETASFAALARRLGALGLRVIVFGGPQERAITAAIAAGGAALDLGGRTDLPLLAAGLAACDLVVSNDSGPLHVAAAVGARTVSLWGAGDPSVTGPLGVAHRLVRHPELPCVPCVKNVCPRSGPGYVLADAQRECMHIISIEEVVAAAREHLARATAAT